MGDERLRPREDIHRGDHGEEETRRSFTPEYKAEIVELCRRGDRSVGQIAKDFDLTETAVRPWVNQAEVALAESFFATIRRERVTRIELALSAWESPQSRTETTSDLRRSSPHQHRTAGRWDRGRSLGSSHSGARPVRPLVLVWLRW
ncbi:transposase [Streptomyces sp. NPDC005506]|uniref:transposase n=1 Tax=unclassified Streptomyces TaxID=2593676 RepID=UPI00368584A4